MLKLAVTGSGGRMGRRIVALAVESSEFEITAGLERSECESLGRDVGEAAGVGALGVAITERPTEKPDVMIDFSLPDSTVMWAEYCAEHKVPIVVGTTGLDVEQKKKLQYASKNTAVLLGANMSLGVNLLFKLVEQVAGKLPEDYDVEVVEAHHRFKRDAPSGTALELSRHIAGARNWPWPECQEHGREGKDALRRDKSIGMHAVRGGDIVGQHSVIFSALGETVTLQHQAHSRDTFVRGALQAAKWLADREAGMYNMFDVLGL